MTDQTYQDNEQDGIVAENDVTNETDILNETPSEAIITMYTASGEQLDFSVAAIIPLRENIYYLLQPLELLPGMGEDEALVFAYEQINEDEATYTIVLDEELIEAVFAEYNRLCQAYDDDE